jgi:type IV secretion system protein VirD4
VLGRYDRNYLRHDGPEHVLCFAPTRSGKGVGLVVPSLLTWPGSAIVHDIKGENWQLTAGFRARHGRVLLFDPTNPKSSPTIRCSRSAAANGKCATSRTSPTSWSIPKARSRSGTIGKRPATRCWSARSSMSSMPRGQDARRRRRLPLRSEAADRVDARGDDEPPHLGEAGPHPVIASAARELLNKSDNERSGVLSTAMSFLGLYRDPVVAEVTRRCDWRIADIVAARHPTTLYLVVPPSDINRTKPLIRLILNQIGRRLTEDLRPRPAPSAAADARRVSGARAGSISSRARWPSWRATASRAS